MNQLELTQIVAQASSLSERLSHGLYNVDAVQPNEQQIERSLDHWCQVVAHWSFE